MTIAPKQKNMKISEFRSNLRKLVKEEIGRRVTEAEVGFKKPVADPTQPRFGGLFSRVQPKPFTAWVQRQYGKYLPKPKMTPVEVIEFLSTNPSALPITPAQLVDMFKTMPAIQKGLGSPDADDEIADVEDFVAKKGDYQTGEKTLKNVSGQVGDLTPTGVKKLQDKAQSKMSKFFGGVSPEDMDDEQINDLFGPGGVWEKAVDLAADKYVQLLAASKGKVDKAMEVLKKSGVIMAGEADLLKDAERVAVQYLIDLVGEGKADKVKELLKRDINHPESNVVKTFQNMVAKVVNPGGQRGRPKGSLNKPKTHR